MKKKSVVQLIVAILVLPLFLLGAFPKNIEAADQDGNVTLTIRKLVFNEEVSPIQNDGSTNPFDADVLLSNDYVGVNGAEFTVYEMTDAYYDRLLNGGWSEDTSIEEIRAEISQEFQAMDKSSMTQQKGVTSTVSGEDGTVSFTTPAKINNQDAVYWIEETGSPSETVSSSEPMLVVLPVLDTNEEELSTIKLFPKSRILETPEITKTIDGDKVDFEIGEEISYTLTTPIPINVATYDSYVIKDTADEKLSLIPDSIQVSVPGLTSEFYQINILNDQDFEIILDPQMVASATGETITVNYQMVIESDIGEQIEFLNEATLIVDGQPVDREEKKVETGGKRFVKVDATEQSKTLAEAMFYVQNPQGEFLSRIDGKNVWGDASELTEDA
ncbi:MAG: pilin N-terminal domain-containing protein, partial [Enterococcus sp.]